MRHFITKSSQGLWQVFNSKNELQDSFSTKELAEDYIKWLEKQIDQEENALSWSTNFFIVEDKHRKSFLIKRISDKKEMDYCDTLDIAERRVLDYEGQIRRNEGETLEEFKERFWIDEKFLIRTKGIFGWNGSEFYYSISTKGFRDIDGKGSTPHEAIERCKASLIATRDELNRLITG